VGWGKPWAWQPFRGRESCVFLAATPLASFWLSFFFVRVAADQYQGFLVPANPTISHSTADEVIDKRLDRIRRRHGETVIREFDVDPRTSLDKDKGKGRAQGVGRFVLSEGEEGETDDEDDSYQPSPWPRRGVFNDYQNYISDYGYGYGHEQARDTQGQPQVDVHLHFVGNAYEHYRGASIIGDDIEDGDSDPDTMGDADNKTPAAMFPPRSVSMAFEIEDRMVFEKPTIFDDDDEGEYLYRESHAVTNTSSVTSNEPVSSDSDLGLSRSADANRGGSSQGTPPPPSHRSTTSRKLKKHLPLLSGVAQSQSTEKFGTIHSASSSSSSFITPPPTNFQDQGFQQPRITGPALSIKKHFGRRWFKGEGGQKWEQRDYEEVIGSLKESA